MSLTQQAVEATRAAVLGMNLSGWTASTVFPQWTPEIIAEVDTFPRCVVSPENTGRQVTRDLSIQEIPISVRVAFAVKSEGKRWGSNSAVTARDAVVERLGRVDRLALFDGLPGLRTFSVSFSPAPSGALSVWYSSLTINLIVRKAIK